MQVYWCGRRPHTLNKHRGWKHLGYKQLKKRGWHGRKFADSDGDRKANIFDCQPLNSKAQDSYYVQGKSKKAINERLAAGGEVYVTNYSIFGGGGEFEIHEIPVGSVLKVFEKYVGGNPYAKAYGTWTGTKIR